MKEKGVDPKERMCLRCFKIFCSSGPGNRTCKSCKKKKVHGKSLGRRLSKVRVPYDT